MPAETIKELRRANHVAYKPTMSTTYEVNRHAWPALAVTSVYLVHFAKRNILHFTPDMCLFCLFNQLKGIHFV